MKNQNLYKELKKKLDERILILDGAMGTMIQQYRLPESEFRKKFFETSVKPLKGNNDLLNVTRPDVITEIHLNYLRAGADILETNTFNANAISQDDYDLESEVKRINQAAVACARAAIEQYNQERAHQNLPAKRVFIAGALGPTNKTASLSPDVNRPGYRAVGFDDLVSCYYEQAESLWTAGADILLPETTFDTLNLKACLWAIRQLQEKVTVQIPLMISVTLTDLSGRTLSGQTLQAFWNSIRHAKPLSVGINCALGAKEMRPFMHELSQLADCYVSCYPNAGLPNPLSPTGYDETPESLALELKMMAQNGYLNIVGGCCGTTPAHIQAVSEVMKEFSPRSVKPIAPMTRLSGLEPLNISAEVSGNRNLIMVGERTNVTGSPKFFKLIKENKMEEAVQIARSQVIGGANLIDINFDEGLLPSEKLMKDFLNLTASEPDIARVPVMIDSSQWSILETGLKCLQGKGVINSISLKEGEEAFLRQAGLAQKYGAAVVVMAFDEKGQAVSKEEKVRICQRAYTLLTERLNFDPCDIIFDVNVLTIGTGLEEHADYAKNFIHAIEEVKKICPGSLTSGGISNLSFSFRGQNEIREALHSVFLFHAVRAGLDMAIVNPSLLQVYEDINPELRQLCEDVIWNLNPASTQNLISWASRQQGNESSSTAAETVAAKKQALLAWREWPLRQRITHSLVQGLDEYIDLDTAEILKELKSPLAVIEGPLMDGMKVVGDLFGQGKMFLPQVVKSARVMKKSVKFLEPWMDLDKSSQASGPTVVLATVKGDVHDIGKNIVGLVMACNGFRIVDLGVMVPGSVIIEAARREKAVMVGLSGLITPSLEEMVFNLQEFEKENFQIPILIGGATTSKVHTAVKLESHYSGPVVHVSDASLVMEFCQHLMGADQKKWVSEYKAEQRKIRESFLASQKEEEFLSIEEARQRKMQIDWSQESDMAGPEGVFEFSIDWNEVEKTMDWSPFFWAWGFKGTYPNVLSHPERGPEAKKLFADVQSLWKKIKVDPLMDAVAIAGFFKAKSENETVRVYNSQGLKVEEFQFQRQRRAKEINQGTCLCLADFIAPSGGPQDSLGVFAVSAGSYLEKLADQEKQNGDDYQSLLIKSLADRLAEGLAEWLHLQVRRKFGYGQSENLSPEEIIQEKYQGIRPAPGYPACPDHELKRGIWKLLGDQIQNRIWLTETLAMSPASSVSGFYFHRPQAKYFHVGPVAE